jgi:hypothetical protein
MAEFDPAKTPYSLSPVLVEAANQAVGQLRARKVSSIVIKEPPTGYRLSNLVRMYTQAYIRRCLTFVDGGMAEHEADRFLLTEQCSRSIYETVASYYDFSRKLMKLLENPNHQELHDFIIARTFATRVPAFLATHGEAIKAPNVLTQLEKLSKNTPNVMEAYERLCDIVHPNGMGAAIYFSKIDETDTAHFTDGGNDSDRTYSSFVMACARLLYFNRCIDELEPLLVELTASATRV